MKKVNTITTKSTCPICKKIIDAAKVIEGQEVYMLKICPIHGEFKILISKDSKRFFDKTFSSPGKERYENQTKSSKKGCPHDCGLCDKHKQHLCSVLIEITGKCNLRCPVCYFGDFEQIDISIYEFKSRLETAMRTENGALDVLQLSGGEPTEHKEFTKILKYSCSQNIKRILINTNGLNLLKNDEIYNCIKSLKDRCEIFLQFDGWNETANIKLRGKNLIKEKIELIEKLNKDDIRLSLAITVIKDNLEELPKILEYACKTKNITGITYQRLTRTGDGENIKQDNKTHLVQEDLLSAISQSPYIDYKGLVPLPCSHENCTSIGFLFVADDKVYSVSDFIDYEKNQDIVRDKIAFDASILNYIKKQLNSCSCCSSFIKKKLPIIDKLKGFTYGKAAVYNNMKILRIVVKNFQDCYTFDTQRAQKCCIGVSVGNNKIIPFCVNNIFRNNFN